MNNPNLPYRQNTSAGALPKFADGVGGTMGAIRQPLCPNARATVRFVFSDTPTRFVSSGVGGKAQVVSDTLPALYGVGELW